MIQLNKMVGFGVGTAMTVEISTGKVRWVPVHTRGVIIEQLERQSSDHPVESAVLLDDCGVFRLCIVRDHMMSKL